MASQCEWSVWPVEIRDRGRYKLLAELAMSQLLARLKCATVLPLAFATSEKQ